MLSENALVKFIGVRQKLVWGSTGSTKFLASKEQSGASVFPNGK
jgi:hypothetical protein